MNEELPETLEAVPHIPQLPYIKIPRLYKNIHVCITLSRMEFPLLESEVW